TNGNLATFTNFPGGIVIPPACSNEVVLNFSPTTPAYLQTVEFAQEYGAPYGTLIVQTNLQPITLNQPSGEYFTLPPTQCGWQFYCQPPGFTISSNVTVIATATNTATGFVGSQSIVEFFTNHVYLAFPITCTASVPGTNVYQGIGKFRFVEADYDSDFGQTFHPFTNYYTMVMVTNSQLVTENFQRVITAPDFQFSAADFAGGATTPGVGYYEYRITTTGVGAGGTTANFTQDAQQPNTPPQAGPGVIEPGVGAPTVDIVLNNVGPIYLNFLQNLNANPFFVDETNETTQGPNAMALGSFDGSTNPPVIYPVGTSLLNLQNEMLVRISPTALADGTNGVPYGPVTFSATGGYFTQPYSWSASNLPQGLTMTSNSNSTGTLEGTPTQSGTFDVVVTMTDVNARAVTWNYTITIH
ncbi:MAG: putative Ig domain-containing protein, partial [Verrucomicrobia bacterium]|nr:putative Ig domain-containing protein [Verrucomicrobiota bacterium]